MRKLIYLITLIMIFTLIGCSGVIGQAAASEEDISLDILKIGPEISEGLNYALNEVSEELRREFNQLMDLRKSLSEKEEILLKELDEALKIGDEFDRLNQELAANSQNEIEDLKKTNSVLMQELDVYVEQLKNLRDDLNQSMTKLYDLDDNNSKLNNDIQMIIIEDTDLVNQLNQKEDQIAILKDQLEQKNEDSS